MIVEAEVLRAAAAVPPAGTMHVLQVDCYRVLRIVEGAYPHALLYAAREAGEPFAAGARFRLKLSSNLPEGAAPLITEPAEVLRLGLFYCEIFEAL